MFNILPTVHDAVRHMDTQEDLRELIVELEMALETVREKQKRILLKASEIDKLLAYFG